MVFKVIVLCILAVAAVQAAVVANVTVGSATVKLGQTVDVNVDISNVSDLFDYQFDIAFDPTKLSANNVTEGGFLIDGGVNTTAFFGGNIDNVGGTISTISDTIIGAVSGVNGAGTLVTLDFTAIGLGVSPVTISNITLEDSQLPRQPIAFISSNGSITSEVPEPRSGPALLIGAIALISPLLKRRVFAKS